MHRAGQPEADAKEPSLVRCRLAIVAAGVLWSLGGLFIKWLGLSAAWHPSAMAITFYRSLSAAAVLSLLLRGRKRPSAADLVVSVALYTLLLSLYVAATQGTTAANAILLQYTAPLFAMILGPPLFRERFVREDAAALIIAMVGIGVLLQGNFHADERGPLLMGLGSGLMFGLFLLWLRRLRHADPVAVTAWNNAGVAAVSGTILLLTRRDELLVLPQALTGHPALAAPVGVLLLMGVVQIAAPYVLFSYGLRRVPAVEASLLSLVEPLLNPVWVMLIVGERPSLPTLAGGGLILAALAVRYTIFRPRATS